MDNEYEIVEAKNLNENVAATWTPLFQLHGVGPRCGVNLTQALFGSADEAHSWRQSEQGKLLSVIVEGFCLQYSNSVAICNDQTITGNIKLHSIRLLTVEGDLFEEEMTKVRRTDLVQEVLREYIQDNPSSNWVPTFRVGDNVFALWPHPALMRQTASATIDMFNDKAIGEVMSILGAMPAEPFELTRESQERRGELGYLNVLYVSGPEYDRLLTEPCIMHGEGDCDGQG